MATKKSKAVANRAEIGQKVVEMVEMVEMGKKLIHLA
jgi:hypothetical protein